MKRKIFLIILVLLLIFGFFAVSALLSAKKATASTQKAATAIKMQDLDGAKKSLIEAQKQFENTKKSLIAFTPLRVVPLIGWYVADAQRGVNAAIWGLKGASTLAEAVTPYADVLGLKGQGTFLGGTAQERIAKALETLSKVTPQLDEVGSDLQSARKDIDQIQSWRYPDFLPAKPGSKITKAKQAIDELESLVVDTKPLLLVLPQIMGQNGEKKYLVLFQNDKELRPTGGFITAYAYFRVDKGTITPEGSEDIYRLDETLIKKVPAPAPILKYLPNVPTLNLRDSNISPDFSVSMKQFEDLYQYTQDKKHIDGIIALDTQFVLSLMKVLGPIDAYGAKFTTDIVDACACPQIMYELERYADEPKNYERGARKDIIGVLMKQMMEKAFSAPKSTWPNLLGTAIGALREKHLLLYFNDQKLQDAAEKMNFAGRINQYDGDYFYINEANFAGAKSNLYIVEDVKQVVKKDKDGINKKVTISYKYPKEADNCSLERKGGLCLAGLYRDWIRIYVPKGSKLIKGTGAETQFATSQDLEKTVFDAFFTVRPTGTAKLELEYTVPIKADKEYKLLIQKQPGVEGHTYEIDAFGKKQKAFPLDTDKELVVKL